MPEKARAQSAILFAVMPWQSLEYPSLACGILHAVAERAGWSATQLYANLRWAKYLEAVTNGRFALADYSLLCDKYVADLAGDWVFSVSLPGSTVAGAAAYRRLFKGPASDFERICLAREHAAAFIDDLAADIVKAKPTVLALSSTFTQNTACLSLAAAVKAKDPAIITVLGGGNCDGPQGIALHRSYAFLDFVVRGEGEVALALLLKAVSAGSDFAAIPNLCWRADERSMVNAEAEPDNLESAPIPHFDAYFAELNANGLQAFVHPHLVMETARGCWWGEKHHCTFCGLNGSTMAFRSKPPDQAFDELSHLVRKHAVLDCIITDNILDARYFGSLLPRIAEAGWDLRIQYEIKANIKPEQAQLMRAAGIVHVQPGIESLSSRVLRLMDKGITGCRNVQALRDLEVAGITVSWNYLIGFPGEEPEDYTNIIEQIPRLYHLQPPRGGVTRVSLQRFSPFFKKPELGFAQRWPHPAYKVVYGLDDGALEDLAFFYSSPQHGISPSLEAALQRAIDSWAVAYEGGSSLVWHERDGGAIVIEDQRVMGLSKTHVLDRPEERAMHSLLRSSSKVKFLKSRTQEASGASATGVEAAFERLCGLGLAFVEDSQAVGVATHWRSLKVSQ